MSSNGEHQLASRSLYIDLVKRCVLNLPYVDVEINPIQPYGRVRTLVLRACDKAGVQLAHRRRGDYAKRVEGSDFSDVAHSMLSMKRLDNVQYCVEDVLDEDVPGDLIETGVMRGGAVILMRAILKAYGVATARCSRPTRSRGCLPPNTEKYPARRGRQLAPAPAHGGVRRARSSATSTGTGCSTTRSSSSRAGSRTRWPTAPLEQIAVLRLDGDLYESTMDAIVPLYPKLSPGGF